MFNSTLANDVDDTNVDKVQKELEGSDLASL